MLLTNHGMSDFAGSELATYTLAHMLRRQGHDPWVYTPRPGHVSARLGDVGFKVTGDVAEWRGERFDVIHFHHRVCVPPVRAVFPDLPAIYVSHGVIPDLEKPPLDAGIDRFVAVSEEVEGMLQRLGVSPDRISVIRNGVNLCRFKPLRRVSAKLNRVLVISNHFPTSLWKLLQTACKRLGAELRGIGIGLDRGPTWETETLMNWADLVVSLGRGALEAMACARAVLVWDVHGGDGLVTPDTYPAIRKCNFSGRAVGEDYGLERLVGLLRQYRPEMGAVNRKLAMYRHDSERLVWDYERVYEWAVERRSSC